MLVFHFNSVYHSYIYNSSDYLSYLLNSGPGLLMYSAPPEGAGYVLRPDNDPSRVVMRSALPRSSEELCPSAETIVNRLL